jgi:hypothetical protein
MTFLDGVSDGLMIEPTDFGLIKELQTRIYGHTNSASMPLVSALSTFLAMDQLTKTIQR